MSVVSGDAVTGRKLTVQMKGTSTGRASVVVEVNPPGIPCGPNATANAHVKRVARNSAPAAYANGLPFDFTFTEPGQYTACVYAADTADSRAPLVVVPFPLPVRLPSTSLSIAVAKRITPGTLAPVSVTTFSEIRRSVAVYLNPVGVPCAPNSRANQGDGLFTLSVLGGPTTVVRNVRAPRTRGQYRFCGYLGSSTNDTAPLQVFSTGIVDVRSPPSRRCTIRRSVIGARSKLRVTCTQAVRGQIRIKATSSGRSKSVLRTLVNKAASVRPTELRMPRGTSTITVSKNGRVLAVKNVRRR